MVGAASARPAAARVADWIVTAASGAGTAGASGARIRVGVAPSLGGAVLGALDFLTSFPEGSIGSGEAELVLLRMVGAIGGNGTRATSQRRSRSTTAGRSTIATFGASAPSR